jgi:hypothetical protein
VVTELTTYLLLEVIVAVGVLLGYTAWDLPKVIIDLRRIKKMIEKGSEQS